MKTLLVILGVVAFVYLDSGYSLECYSCNMTFSILPLKLCRSVMCPEGLDQCYINKTLFPVLKIEKGCTTNCTQTWTDKCCETNKCNII
uniref:Three finger toxin 1 n=1 Tax=Sistrurus catenatus edwardsii TaxID=8762 RepID=A5X2W6_SISCA|nr:three finger toxin 1 [Sistrurus catenatus edwardsi]ABZ89716.1 three finger toxin 1 precursor [Sistrurus catenatus edwardsi]